MKRLIPLLCAVLLLAGCKGLYPEEYVYAEPHMAPFAYQETTAVPTSPTEEAELPPQAVYYLSDIRTGIQKMILEGRTVGTFLLRDYREEKENLPEAVKNDLETISPKYVYHASLTLNTEETPEGLLLHVKVRPGLTREELKSIPSRLYSNALPSIYEALINFQSSYMIEINGYVETDFVSLLERYAIDRPNVMVEMPKIEVSMQPESGAVRFIIFRFSYEEKAETLLGEREVVNSLLDGYQAMFSPFDEPQTMLDTMYKLLVPASGYEEKENASVYSLLLSKEGSSRMMAAVAAYLCKRAGADCKIVQGEREGETWYWNQLNTETRSFYFDLHTAALSRSDPILLTADEMIGYTWDTSLYPEVVPPEPPETSEPEEPEPTMESTEPTEEPTGPTEEPSEEPTEPTEGPAEPTEEPTDPTEEPTESPTEAP